MVTLPQQIRSKLSPEADTLVHLATQEARDLGAGSVGPEHVLLALLRDPESEIARALESLRLTYERVQEVVAVAASSEHPPSTVAPDLSRASHLVLERADDEAIYRDSERIRPAHILAAIDPWEESIARVFAGLRPRLRPHDFVKAARSVPGLDGE